MNDRNMKITPDEWMSCFEQQDPSIWIQLVTMFIHQELYQIMDNLNRIQTVDHRYKKQISHFYHIIESMDKRCQFSFQHDVNISCHDLEPCHFCYDTKRVCGIPLCASLRNQIKIQAIDILSFFVSQWISGFYYLCQLYYKGRFHLNFFIEPKIKPLNQLSSWEVVCENEDEQLLSHPSLPDPSDFILHKKKLIGDSYVEKAQFEYSFPKTLENYSVTFPKNGSFLPCLSSSSVSLYKPSINQKNEPSQNLLRINICYKNNKNKKKKKPFSKIQKETRKKHKRYYHRGGKQCEIINAMDEQNFLYEQIDDVVCRYDRFHVYEMFW